MKRRVPLLRRSSGFLDPIFEKEFELHVHGFDHDSDPPGWTEKAFAIPVKITLAQDTEDASRFEVRVSHGRLVVEMRGAANGLDFVVHHEGKAEIQEPEEDDADR